MSKLIQENIPLAPLTNFRVGGPARYFVNAKNTEDVIEALKFAREQNAPFFMLGGGMNVLASDAEYPGMIIHFTGHSLQATGEQITADAGCTMGQVVTAAQKEGLTGMEWASGLPGTVGGAVFGNSGCFGGETKDVVSEVQLLNPKKDELRITKYVDLEPAYRHTRLKETGDVVISATFKLTKGSPQDIAAGMERVRQKTKERIAEQPRGARTAGSTYKGITVTDAIRAKLESSDALWQNGINRAGFLSSGWLLEQVGLKGYQVGDASFSAHHANFIINNGKATAENIRELIREGKRRVRERFGIEMEEEIRYIGI